MNKRAAKTFALNNTTMTYIDLINIINGVTDLSGHSNINPELPREYLFNSILKPWIKTLEERNIDLNKVINTTRMCFRGRKDKIILNPDGISLYNVIRECKYKP